MASKSGIEAGRAFVRMFLMDDELRAKLGTLQSKLRATAAVVGNIGAQMTAAGVAMTVPFAAALAMFVPFSDAMKTVAAVTRATADEFEMLNAKAKLLGATTSFTAVQVAQMMTELGRAGFSPAQIDEMTAAVMNLSRASGTEAAMASGIMAATIRQFSLEAGDAAHVADVLTYAANSTFNTVESLGEALKYAGPVAAQLGMSLEDTVAILGTLGNVGIQGSEAGTALRRLSVLSAAEADKMQKTFGVAFKDAAGNARPLVTVLGEVANATKDMSDTERVGKMNEAFGLLGITAATVMSGAAADTEKLAAGLKTADGAAAKTAAEMDSGLGGSLKIFMSSVEGVAIAVSEAIEGPLKWLLEWFTWISEIIKHTVQQNQTLIQVLAIIGPVVATLGIALVGIATAIGIVTGAMFVWTAATSAQAAAQAVLLALSGPAGLIALAAGLAFAGTAVYAISEGYKSYTKELEENKKASDEATASVKKLNDKTDALNGTPQPNLAPLGTQELLDAEEAVKKLTVSMAGLRGATAEVLAQQSGGDALSALALLGGDAAANSADRLRTMVDAAISPSEKLKRKLLELDATLQALGRNVPPDLRAQLQLNIIEDATGAVSGIRKLQDEIAILAGITTEAEQQLQALAESGAPPELLNQYRELTAERDRLKQISEADKKAKTDAEDKLSELRQQAESIKTQNQTGREKIAVQLEQLETLKTTLDPNTGTPLLDEETYSRALRKLHKEQRQLAGEDASRIRSPKVNSSADIRSAEGAKFLVDLINGRGGIEQQTLQAALIANRQRAALLAAVEKQNVVAKASTRTGGA